MHLRRADRKTEHLEIWCLAQGCPGTSPMPAHLSVTAGAILFIFFKWKINKLTLTLNGIKRFDIITLM